MPTKRRIGRSRVSLIWLTVLVAALTAILAACGGTSSADKTATAGAGVGGKTPAAGKTVAAGGGGTITVKKGEALKLGLSTTLTTDNAVLGESIQNGAKLAVKEKGEVKGFTVTLDAQDDLCSGPGSVDAANKLITDGVVAVIGPMCSSGTVAALDPYSKENLLVMSSSSTAVTVTQQGKKDFFRTAWNDATQGAEMAKYAYTTLGKKSAVLVNDQSPYGKGLMEVFKKSFTDLGGTIASEEAVTVGEKDFGPTVTKIKGENPDIVVFGGFIAEGAILVRQLNEAGVTASFMGADGIADQKFIDQAGSSAEGVYVSRGPKPTDTSLFDKFAASHKTEFGTDPGQFAEQTYDAVNIVLDAIAEVATVDADGNLVIDKDALIAAVRKVDYKGASGEIQFNDVGDRLVVGAVNEIDQVKDGKLSRVQ
jgi:branched-chain amino acid transport system substrate-binding protein